MTKYVILAVRDRALDAYMQPIFVPAVGLAIRSFSDEVNRPDSPMCAHPEDYDLYQLGMYDDATASIVTDNPRMVAVGKDVKRPVGSGA